VKLAVVCVLGCASTVPPPSEPVTALPLPSVSDPTPISLPPETAETDEVGDWVAPPVELAVLQRVPGVAIIQSENSVEHEHGGKPATLDHAWIKFDIEDRRPHAISAERVELLRAACRETDWHDRKPLRVTGYRLYRDDADPIATGHVRIALPTVPNRYTIAISFAPVTAYQACDRFAYAVQLIVDGARISLELPLDVMRIEPLRQ
jgi:hypothetical protein